MYWFALSGPVLGWAVFVQMYYIMNCTQHREYNCVCRCQSGQRAVMGCAKLKLCALIGDGKVQFVTVTVITCTDGTVQFVTVTVVTCTDGTVQFVTVTVLTCSDGTVKFLAVTVITCTDDTVQFVTVTVITCSDKQTLNNNNNNNNNSNNNNVTEGSFPQKLLAL